MTEHEEFLMLLALVEKFLLFSNKKKGYCTEAAQRMPTKSMNILTMKTLSTTFAGRIVADIL